MNREIWLKIMENKVFQIDPWYMIINNPEANAHKNRSRK